MNALVDLLVAVGVGELVMKRLGQIVGDEAVVVGQIDGTSKNLLRAATWPAASPPGY